MPRLLILFSLILLFLAPPALADEIDNLVNRSKRFSNSGNYLMAYDALWRAFKKRPGDVEINFLLGKAAYKTKNFEASAMAFERVLISDPGYIQAKIELAKSFVNLGATETARGYFEEVLQSEIPDNVRINIEQYIKTNL